MTTPLNIALLGDSIFDNARYVLDGYAVIDHLRRALPIDSVTLLATDGDITRDVFGQLQRLPQDTSHLVLSVGGNDALGWLPTLDRPTRSLLEALDHLHTIQAEFQGHYDFTRELIPTAAFVASPPAPCAASAARLAAAAQPCTGAKKAPTRRPPPS